MRKSDLTAQQARDINIFNLILETYDWVDPQDTETRLEEGEMVNPEGYRLKHNRNSLLQVQFHAPVNMISLLITDYSFQDQVQFHFLYDEKPERILEWIVENGEELSLASYPDLLKQANGRCEMILLEVSDSEIYEVKPPTC